MCCRNSRQFEERVIDTPQVCDHRSDIVALWRAAKSSHARRQALGGEFDQTEARALRALSILFASVCLFI